MKKIYCILLLNILSCAVFAQQMTVQAPKSVYEGDNFTVRFVVDARTHDFQGPSFKGFSLRSGPNTSSSSSYSFVNGQATSSVQTIFSYTLTADVAGTFTVNPATCTVDGKKVSSQSFSITVQKADPSRKAQQQQQRQQQHQAYDPWGQQPQQSQQIDEHSLFARASISKSNPYQGEQVIVTYKIYTQIPISQFGIDKLPGNRGFWAEDLSDGMKIKQYEETVGDRRYQVAEIRRGALFAQQSGQLAIEPLDLNVLAMVQRQRRRTGTILDLFDDPFFSAREAVERSLRTNRLTVNVKPLPSAPDIFTGGVGHFDLKGGLTLDKVKANEAVSYKVTLSGQGNLMLIDAPHPEFPSVFEVYDPQVEDNIRKGENGVSGSRTYEWILIPRSQGRFTIPELQLAYFDPQAGRYITLKVPAQKLDVEKGDTRNIAHSGSKDDVKLLNNDINYIHPVGHLHPLKSSDQTGWLFWLSLAMVVILTVATLLWGKKHRRDELDTLGMARKHATRLARKRLRRAESHMKAGDESLFYDEIYRAVWGCLADKYSIELAKLSCDTVAACLVEKHVPEQQQVSIMQLLQDVDMARFAPGDAGAQMHNIYNEALNMIANM